MTILTCGCRLTAICCSGKDREDDKEEIIAKRLEVYHAQTEPLIAYYRAKNCPLFTIEASGTKDEVFSQVLKACETSILVPFESPYEN